jgi:hypothetical protein
MADLGRDLAKLVYFDSSPPAFWLSPDNSRPLKQYQGAAQDNALEALAHEVAQYAGMVDVRQALISRFRIRALL